MLGLLLSERLAYRKDFIITFLASFSWSLAAPFFIFLVYSAGGQYPGWDVYELLVFIGLFNIIRGIGITLFEELFYKVIERVREGRLELVLIKPKDELYLLFSESFRYTSLGEVSTGIGLLMLGIFNTSLEINFLLLILYTLAALSFLLAMTIFTTTLAIKYVQVERLMELLDTILQFAEYPKNLFPRGVQLGFAVFLPLFIISYYPASALLGYETSYPFLIIASCIAILGLAILYWKKTLKNYIGAGG